MNFDRALVTYPDGRLASLTPAEFYAIPLAERIQLLTTQVSEVREGQPADRAVRRAEEEMKRRIARHRIADRRRPDLGGHGRRDVSRRPPLRDDAGPRRSGADDRGRRRAGSFPTAIAGRWSCSSIRTAVARRASLQELERIIEMSGPSLQTYVLVYRPADFQAGWEKTETSRSGEAPAAGARHRRSRMGARRGSSAASPRDRHFSTTATARCASPAASPRCADMRA